MDPGSYSSNGGSFLFLSHFRPSSTPYIDFSNPGACNIKLHSIYTPISYSGQQKIIPKQTSKDVQKGGGSNDHDFLPIKVKRTFLSQFEKQEINKLDTIQGTSKKEKEREETVDKQSIKEGPVHSEKTLERKRSLEKNSPKIGKKKKYCFQIKN